MALSYFFIAYFYTTIFYPAYKLQISSGNLEFIFTQDVNFPENKQLSLPDFPRFPCQLWRLILLRCSLLKAFMFLQKSVSLTEFKCTLIKMNGYKLCYRLHAQNQCCKISCFLFFPAECLFYDLSKMFVN